MYIKENQIDRVEGSIVYFADGKQKEYTKRQLEYIITEEPKDETAFMELVIGVVMTEVQEVIDKGLEEMDTVGKVLDILENHDVNQEQLQWVLDDIIWNRVKKHNDFMKSAVWTEIEKFEADMKRYKEFVKTLADSHKRAVCIAIGKAFWTYVEWEYHEKFWNNISFSNIKKFI